MSTQMPSNTAEIAKALRDQARTVPPLTARQPAPETIIKKLRASPETRLLMENHIRMLGADVHRFSGNSIDQGTQSPLLDFLGIKLRNLERQRI